MPTHKQKKARVPWLVTLALLWVALVRPVFAQSAITVVRSEHEHVFKGPLTFRLEATSGQKITEVNLYYRPSGQTASHKVELDVAPGTIVQVEHVEDMDDPENYQPPMIEFTYWWVIKDEGGNQLRTERATFFYDDTRYTWDVLESERVRVYWHDQSQEFGQRYFALATQSAERLADEFGVSSQDSVAIVIYNSHDELMSVLQEASAEWTGAVNFGESGCIAIGLGSQSWMDKVIPHELTHAMLEQITKPPFGDIPRWLHEGLAVRSEGGMSAEEDSALTAAIENDTLISLRVLNSPFPDERARAILSYAESNSLVTFIIDEYGAAKLGELIAVFAEGAHYDDAMMEVFGVDMDGMEDLWRAHIGARPRQSVTQASPVPDATPHVSTVHTVTPQATGTAVPTPSLTPAIEQAPTPAPSSRVPCLGALTVLGLAALFAVFRPRPSP